MKQLYQRMSARRARCGNPIQHRIGHPQVRGSLPAGFGITRRADANPGRPRVRISRRMPKTVFIAGATGYMGRRLVSSLAQRGHTVRALVRPGSETGLPPKSQPVMGNALDASTYAQLIPPGSTFVHLIGTPHPAPWKEREFIRVDLTSLREAVQAAQTAQAGSFVYVSVAHPAPAMKAYIRIREQCERMLNDSGLNATILRPWYVLGPGHRWPVALKPLYWLAEQVQATRAGALRLGLVTLDEMVGALVWAVENPAPGQTCVEVPEIRAVARRMGDLPA